jgi:hypothetical protein
MGDINEQYYNKQQSLVKRLQKEIQAIYESAITDITFIAATLPIKSERFSLSLYPLIEKTINAQLVKLHESIADMVIRGITGSWDLSNAKNDIIVDRRLASRKPSQRAKQILYDPNAQAMEQFIFRKERGLDLSKRVWNSVMPFKKELEQGLGLGIKEGRSARSLAAELKAYLKEPDRLYRRVRGEDGQLQLSANARAYNPGQGVYRSSFKNALRLTSTETNMAYRNADFERWQNMPFVTGIKIQTSNNHPKYDICDALAGNYPKTFHWAGWHAACRCHQVPILMSETEYDKLEDKILGIGILDQRTISRTVNIPTRASKWIEENADRLNALKKPPYWVRDNKKFVSELLR